jgi:two-component system sensor histidine kinase HydH
MNPAGKQRIAKLAVIVLLVATITYLHYRTSDLEISYHVIFRELYFLPIILASFWFGLIGGLGTALAVTLLYLPFVLAMPGGLSGHNLGNLMEIIIFNISGALLGFLRDREKREHEKLLAAEGLAAMGRAVACIAHNLKTPLMAIGGFIRQMQRQVIEKKLTAKLEIAFTQVRRLETMVGDMLAFVRPLRLDLQPGEINRLLEEVEMLAREKAAGQEIRLALDMQPEIPAITFDHQRLQQAMLNLLNNALEATHPGGMVFIRSLVRQTEVIIEIADQGQGIPRRKRRKSLPPSSPPSGKAPASVCPSSKRSSRPIAAPSPSPGTAAGAGSPG